MTALAPAALSAKRSWAPVAGTGCSLAGVGVSGYLTFEHFTASSTLACPATGSAIDCLKVTTSSYSQLLGMPVALLGLVFFAVMLLLQLPAAWASAAPAVRAGRVLWAALGVGTALWLIYAELFLVNAICLWCTAVHALTIVLFALTAVTTATTAGAGFPDGGGTAG
ncbi:MAG TPA: vitamin K epoxide reductase family protein [Acidimicrobiales bacterium]|nr:vitamin K epoxide reductase family protein [Acidimicrobiales bacterium]